MKRSFIIDMVISLLVLLFVHTAVSKLLAYADYRLSMGRQALPKALLPVLVPVLPAAELLAAACLLFRRTRRIGLYVSAILMLVFTTYVALAVSGFFPHLPCSCGGVIAGMGWTAHLILNVIVLLLNILAIVLENRERRIRLSHR
ncbi:MauE/DoxX family redox-associated membrane protein [Mucilaginibacter aquatilis]|uniref:Methylamine utilisation protein MauE domain-containing protein n=1 Tax=Mucilaginibacter aquatilis TaxID=1517760 RepID=A0A6I4IDN8_9SPHI|nr:MauE/DoxX family redox-associated membrane protein [Mucilaginibacter aquatilis]MVN91489.1 hypothetical protein [Mucilaginibacter aquatilis]